MSTLLRTIDFRFLRLMAVTLVIGHLWILPSAMAGSPEAARFYEDALVRFEKNDLAGAKLQLKNALQQDPAMLAARVLLGRVHLKSGDGAAAEKELILANQLGGDRSLTVVPLAEAYLMQFKYQDVIDRIHTEDFKADIRNKLLGHRGQAFLEIGKYDKAERVFSELHKLSPGSATSYIGRAMLTLRRGRAKDALELARQAVSLESKNAAAWNIKASIHHALGQLEQALADYERVLQLQPTHIDAKIARIGIWIDQGRVKQAGDALAVIRKEVSLEPRAAYLHSVVLGQTGDIQGARKALEEAASIIGRIKPEFINRRSEFLMLAGVTYYSLNQFEKARPYLNSYIKRHPQQVGARKLLGALLIASDDTGNALSVLKPAYELAPNDFRVLSLLGTAYMRQGRHREASRLLEQAVELSSGSPEMRTELAMSRIGTGEQLSALAELNDIFSKDIHQARAGVLLGMLHIRRGEYAKAVTVAEKLYRQQPDNLTALNLLGTARVLSGNRTGARSVFQQAVAVDGKFIPARIALARLDALDGQSDKAVAALKALLKDAPDSSQIKIELARVEDHRNNQGEAIRWLEKARGEDRNEIQARLYLADLYMRNNKADLAIEVSQEAELIAKDNLSVLEVSARSYVAAGKLDIAKTILKRMNSIAGFDADWLYRIARFQIRINALDDAIYSLHKAVNSKPDFLAVQVALVETQLRAGRVEHAAERAADVLTKFSDKAVSHRLMGDVALQQQRYPDAISHYRMAARMQESTLLAVRIYRAHQLAGDMPAAIRHLEQWSQAHKKDMVAQEALAEGYLVTRNFNLARQYFERLVDEYPTRADLYNNLAYIYHRLKHTNALPYARRAHQMAPDDAGINDTLGWILVQQGKAEEGLPYLRNAHVRMSSSPEIRYHIAVALHRLGRNTEARTELDKALASKQSFDGIEQARQLRQQLDKP